MAKFLDIFLYVILAITLPAVLMQNTTLIIIAVVLGFIYGIGMLVVIFIGPRREKSPVFLSDYERAKRNASYYLMSLDDYENNSKRPFLTAELGALCAQEMHQQVKLDTPVGKHFVEMFAREEKRSLSSQTKDDPNSPIDENPWAVGLRVPYEKYLEERNEFLDYLSVLDQDDEYPIVEKKLTVREMKEEIQSQTTFGKEYIQKLVEQDTEYP